jgi:5-methylcytosine-specific restriction protein A
MTDPYSSTFVAERLGTRFYLTPEWRALMDAIIVERFGSSANARCEDPECTQPHRCGIRIFGGHIREVKDDLALFDKRNILCRCSPCHKRAQNRVYARRCRNLAKERKRWFHLKLNEDLVATALFATGRDRGSELYSHEECEGRLCAWVNEILDVAVRSDLPKRCGPEDSLRSNRGLRPK